MNKTFILLLLLLVVVGLSSVDTMEQAPTEPEFGESYGCYPYDEPSKYSPCKNYWMVFNGNETEETL